MADYKTKSDKPLGAGSPIEYSGNPRAFRNVWYVQVHDSFSPLQMAPLSSLSMIGHNPMLEMVEKPNGIFVRCMGKKKGVHDLVEREFLVPYGNISHYEYDTDK